MPATKSVSKNISNLAHTANHKKRVAAQGKAGAHKQEIAIAYSEARKAGNKKVGKAKTSPGADKPAGRKRKRPRNKGRS
jgi:hypothetical protein